MPTTSSASAQSSGLGSSKIVAFVATTNAEQTKAFYRDVLGLRFVADDGFALQFDANGIMLRIAKAQKISVAPYTVLGWEVSDIEAKAKELTKAGVKFERFTGMMEQDELGIWDAPGGVARVAWFKDPDGNILSISQHS